MIYSPSYKRAQGVYTHKILPEVVYCVHEFEAKEYIDLGYNVEVLPDDLRGNIARVRNYIKDQLLNNSGVIIDDDIRSIKAWGFNSNGEPVQADVQDAGELIEQLSIVLTDSPYRLLGINIVSDKGSYREYTPISTKTYISGSFMIFDNNELRFDEQLPLKEDYDFTIQNCNTYRGVIRMNQYSLVKDDHANIGGCADYRNMIREKEQLQMLIKKWGSRIVKEDTKSSNKQKNHDLNPIVKIPIKGV